MNLNEWLAHEWARQLGPALSSMTGEAVQAEVSQEAGGAPGKDALPVVRRLREAPEALLILAVSPGLWQKAGHAVLRGADLPAGEEDEVRGAFLEVVQQSLGQLAVSLGRRLGREVVWEEVDGEPAAEPGQEWVQVEVASGGDVWGKAWLTASSGFLPESSSEESAGERLSNHRDPSAEERRPMLDLLMEVELPVAVTFGRTQMRLREAIKLTSGSIVELNRSIIEPVEVVVNNCVIARGEVVVVEGNYGVRIQEIVSREQRLRTLF